MWCDGDILTLVHRAKAEEVKVLPGIQFPMWRVEGELWALMVRIRELDRATLNLYGVASSGGHGPGRLGGAF
ncbi:MAG: hypothetical protein M3075_16500 [Candidatus Dormibacteraeota bacterium]|nr:hypothetical protein [Candidatus Dormibacteraeota bacterium]MDQ6920470.1 hypothetical protein [Candidatus Dormibacteraeota bacterium]